MDEFRFTSLGRSNVFDSYEQIKVSVEDRVATVTLNRPDRSNALGTRIVEELERALEEIEGSEDVRALILTGAGEKAFCSGADLKERREMDADERWEHNRALNSFAERLARLQVPTVAAINGLAFGGGSRSPSPATSVSPPTTPASPSRRSASA